ncbi:unnamed protein product [Rhodiola kirilowii]
MHAYNKSSEYYKISYTMSKDLRHWKICLTTRADNCCNPVTT